MATAAYKEVRPDSLQRNTQNASVHSAHSPLVSVNRGGTIYQVMVFWGEAKQLVIGRRNRTTGSAWTWWEYPDILTRDDSHNAAGVGIDLNGIMHFGYDMHAEPLRYRRSLQPVESFDGTLTAQLSMLGTNESQATYPVFFNDPSGTLYFLFRNGGSGTGDTHFYRWDHVAKAWGAAPGTGAGGLLLLGQPDGVNPYHSIPPVFDANFGSGGFMHMFWCYRSLAAGIQYNSRVCYVRWDGTTFTKSDGTAQTIPIRTANVEIADPVPENSRLANVNSPCVSDSNGVPLVHYSKADANGNIQLYALHRGATAWVITQVSALPAGVEYAHLGGTLSISNDSMIDRATNTAYIVFRLDREIRVFQSAPGNYTSWTDLGAIHTHPSDLAPGPDTNMIPAGHDRKRWADEKVWEIRSSRAIDTTG